MSIWGCGGKVQYKCLTSYIEQFLLMLPKPYLYFYTDNLSLLLQAYQEKNMLLFKLFTMVKRMTINMIKLILLTLIIGLVTGCVTTIKQPYLIDSDAIPIITSSDLKILINTEIQKEFVPIRTPEVVGAGSLFQLADEGQNSAAQRANQKQLMPLMVKINDDKIAQEIGLSLVESLTPLDWLNLSSAQISHYNNAKGIIESEDVQIAQAPDLTLYASYQITLSANLDALTLICELSAIPNNPKLYKFAQHYAENKPTSKGNTIYLNTLRASIPLPDALTNSTLAKRKSKLEQSSIIDNLAHDDGLSLQQLVIKASLDLASQAQQSLNSTVAR